MVRCITGLDRGVIVSGGVEAREKKVTIRLKGKVKEPLKNPGSQGDYHPYASMVSKNGRFLSVRRAFNKGTNWRLEGTDTDEYVEWETTKA